MIYPEYVEIDGKKYKINTDYRYAIRCNEIATDSTIGDIERPLAIIYTLFGEEGINSPYHYEKLLELALKYLSCGEEIEDTNEEPDMDFVQDMDFIEASFMSDYHIDISEQEMHWWKFMNLMNGLSNSDMGNCCILNRVRNLRSFDLSTIKDTKERSKIKEQQDRFRLKKKVHHTKEQIESVEKLMKDLGIRKEE